MAAAPTVAFAASESDLAQACSIEGTPTVVAAHVLPMAGVTAQAEGGRVWLRFATKSDPRAALAVTPSTLEVEEVEGAAPEETHPARQVPAGPVAVALEGGRHLVAWTDGSAYSGHAGAGHHHGGERRRGRGAHRPRLRGQRRGPARGRGHGVGQGRARLRGVERRRLPPRRGARLVHPPRGAPSLSASARGSPARRCGSRASCARCRARAPPAPRRRPTARAPA